MVLVSTGCNVIVKYSEVLLSTSKYRRKYLCLHLITCLEIGHILTSVLKIINFLKVLVLYLSTSKST